MQAAAPPAQTAAIVVIGNEVLSAKVVDENGPWLLKELRALGVEVRRVETVPDEIPLIVESVQRACASAEHVFTSGGIGPTHDDVTIAALAQAFDRKVVTDPRSLELLQKKFGSRMNAAVHRLAEIPEGATLTWNEQSLFPVISLEQVVILPGVPSLFKIGFQTIRERFRAPPIFSRAVYLSLGESLLAEHLDATVAAFPEVGIGSYPRFDDADHRVKVTFDGRVAIAFRQRATSSSHACQPAQWYARADGNQLVVHRSLVFSSWVFKHLARRMEWLVGSLRSPSFPHLHSRRKRR